MRRLEEENYYDAPNYGRDDNGRVVVKNPKPIVQNVSQPNRAGSFWNIQESKPIKTFETPVQKPFFVADNNSSTTARNIIPLKAFRIDFSDFPAYSSTQGAFSEMEYLNFQKMLLEMPEKMVNEINQEAKYGSLENLGVKIAKLKSFLLQVEISFDLASRDGWRSQATKNNLKNAVQQAVYLRLNMFSLLDQWIQQNFDVTTTPQNYAYSGSIVFVDGSGFRDRTATARIDKYALKKAETPAPLFAKVEAPPTPAPIVAKVETPQPTPAPLFAKVEAPPTPAPIVAKVEAPPTPAPIVAKVETPQPTPAPEVAKMADTTDVPIKQEVTTTTKTTEETPEKESFFGKNKILIGIAALAVLLFVFKKKK